MCDLWTPRRLLGQYVTIKPGAILVVNVKLLIILTPVIKENADHPGHFSYLFPHAHRIVQRSSV